MSLSKEGFEKAVEKNRSLNERVNKKFQNMGIALSDKVQMDHYGKLYLFGNEITEQTTDEELTSIIESTPEKNYEGSINAFGQWTNESK